MTDISKLVRNFLTNKELSITDKPPSRNRRPSNPFDGRSSFLLSVPCHLGYLSLLRQDPKEGIVNLARCPDLNGLSQTCRGLWPASCR